jgi:predicted dehydrogenase
MSAFRLGLIGTGYWARSVHARSAATNPNVELVGVWGRNSERTQQLANDFGIRAYTDPDALIEDVDALTFAVPPTVQIDIALRAVRRGRHVLLEKPVALSTASAQELEETISANNVASIVFFTQRFVPTTQTWLRDAAASGGWVSGRVEMASNIYAAGGPFASSAWRREYGALWDIGPHALAFLWPVMGEVTAVVAGRGVEDQVHLIMRHAGGGSSTASVSLTCPPAAIGRTVYFDGEQGRWMLPPPAADQAETIRALQSATDALIEQSGESQPQHPCDAHFGARVVEALAAAEESLKTGRWVELHPAA